ncbi:Rieske (2Fe-2S) protein [Loktanella sp. S4079]|uniref:Rieske (2Fe-2S) protein n=1 Tax=Loktanella sp. S4079 TaxID=579483 RepID=UPI0005FA8177|nr:Rieske (2Fe-2S) protein [Loktanella sp. S4079]
MSWRDYSTAPPSGTVVCASNAVGTIRTIVIDSPRGRFPMIVVRTSSGIRAYVNACPHQYLPLDYRGDQVVSACGGKLLCTAHGASFDILSGSVLSGAECGLDPVPVVECDDEIRIGTEMPDRTEDER